MNFLNAIYGLLEKQAIYFFIIATGSFSHAQNSYGYVVYDWFQNMGLSYQSQTVLYFNESESLYKELSEENLQQTPSDSLTSVYIKFDAKESTYTNFKTQKIISQGLIFTKAYVVFEDLLKIKWEIFNEFQKIGKYNCQKAVGSFRGRTYEVWFTSEIPLSFGPWKLNGLPGLVLKVTESKGKILFDAVKIVINNSSQKEEIIKNIQIPAIGKKISLKEFASLKDKESDDLLKYIISKEGRSFESSIISSENAGRDFKYEISYEWEKPIATKVKD